MKPRQARQLFALCLNDGGAEDLLPRKVYQVLPDKRDAAKGFLRVIDESGEDYLYPAKQFVLLDLPQTARRLLSSASQTLRAA